MVAIPLLYQIKCYCVRPTYLAWRADGLRDLAVIAYFIIIILSSLLLERRFALTVTIFSIASIWFFAILEEQGARVLHVDQPISYARDLTGITILIASLIYLLVTGWSRTLQSAKNELQECLRIEEKLKKQAEYLTALHEITLGLVNRLELTPLLEFILSQASMLLNTPHVGLDLLLPDKSALKQELGYGILALWESPWLGSKCGTRWQFVSRRPPNMGMYHANSQ